MPIKQTPYRIRLSAVEVGEEVYILGFPLPSSMGNELKLTTGVVSSSSGYHDNPALFQVSAPVQPGNSGGPVFDKEGRLIGVVNAKHTDAENVTYAIKVKYLVDMLTPFGEKLQSNKSNSLKKKTLQEQVKAIRDFVFIITARRTN